MKDLLTTAYEAMDEKLAENIVVIDFREQSPFLDYFIITVKHTPKTKVEQKPSVSYWIKAIQKTDHLLKQNRFCI